MEKQMETTTVYWGYIGIMEKQMETTTVYWGCIGIMEKKMETTIVYWGYVVEVGMICWLGNVNFHHEYTQNDNQSLTRGTK